MASTRHGAKIVCTIGPATASLSAITALIDAGMDVARLNFSHGGHESHAATFRFIRQAADATGRTVAVLADLCGPKIRLGKVPDGAMQLLPDQEITIVAVAAGNEVPAGTLPTTYEQLAGDVRVGDAILIDDGLVRLTVLSVDSAQRAVRCRVVQGGRVSDHKGINLPGVPVSTPALTAKDEVDLRFALALGVDLVALSFVRNESDVESVRRIMRDCAVERPVFAKVEKPEAVERLDAIIDAFDGIMVARGDLGVEMPLEHVPLVQKRAVTQARAKSKPVIVATQMLESMIVHPRPTRAEASDVANAVLDGADALMLSGETSVGAHPLEAVRTMARIIVAAESQPTPAPIPRGQSIPEALATVASELSRDLSSCAVVAFTESGSTARFVAARRPSEPVLAFTPYAEVARQLAVVWGVEPFVMPTVASTDAMVSQVEKALVDMGRGQPGDEFIVVGGTPPGRKGSTNTVRVHRLPTPPAASPPAPPPSTTTTPSTAPASTAPASTAT